MMNKRRVNRDFGILPNQPFRFISDLVDGIDRRLNRFLDNTTKKDNKRYAPPPHIQKAVKVYEYHAKGRHESQEIAGRYRDQQERTSEEIKEKRKKELQNIKESHHREPNRER